MVLHCTISLHFLNDYVKLVKQDIKTLRPPQTLTKKERWLEGRTPISLIPRLEHMKKLVNLFCKRFSF